MRLEIVLLLLIGMTPNKVSEKLGIPIDTVYYNNRALKKAMKVIENLK